MSSIIQALPFYLNAPLGASDTTIQVKGLKNSRGVAITAMPSGVALIHVTIEPKSPTNQEIISFTGITDNGNGVVTLTGVTRNLNPVSPFTALTPDVPHANNSTCVISNNPQIFQDVVMTNEARTVTAVVTFGASPIVPTAVNAGEPVNKAQLDLAVLGTVPASSTTVLGAVRVATDPTKTLGNVSLTIASPCVAGFSSHGLTANDTIRFTTTGALPTGVVAGTTYYVIATGLTGNTFQFSTTAGGSAINTSGGQSGTHTLYRTTPYAVNDQDTRLPTQGENDALVGTSGTPSSSNPYITNDDSSTTLSGTKAIRANSGVYPAGDGSAITGLGSKLSITTTDVTFASSTAENTLLSYSLAGGVLSTNNAVRIVMHVTALGITNGNTWTLRFKYGGTTLTTKAHSAIGANASLLGRMEFILAGAGTTSSQNGSHSLTIGQAGYVGNGNPQPMMFSEASQGTSAINSTTAQTISITSQHSNSNALDNITVALIVVEKIV